mgnify:CR=1 FL=1
MTTVADILDVLEALAPTGMKMDWDNVGLLCGRFDAPVDTVLVALDPQSLAHNASSCIARSRPSRPSTD